MTAKSKRGEMQVFLIEFVDEAQALLHRYRKDFFLGKDTLVIAFNPKVRVFLKREGIPCEDTCAYLDNEAQHRIIFTSERWTLQLIDEFKITDPLGISAGYREVCIHHLRLYINHFLWILEILKGLNQRYSITELFACLPENRQTMYGRQGYLQDQERFLGFLAKEYADTYGLGFQGTYLNINSESGWWERILCRFFRWIVLWAMTLDLKLALGKEKGFGELIVVPALSYRMDLLLKEIQQNRPTAQCLMIWEGETQSFKKEGVKLYFTLTNFLKRCRKRHLLETVVHLDVYKTRYPRDPDQRLKIQRVFEHIFEMMQSRWKDQFNYEGVDVGVYLREKIQFGLMTEIQNLEHTTAVVDDLFRRLRPKLLMSMYSAGIYYMMGEVAQRQGIPALNISHGTHVPPNNEAERIENYRLASSVILNSYPYVAVQTPWTERFLDYYQDRRQRIFTGPLLFSVTNPQDRREIRSSILGENAGGKIIVHATTQKDRASFRFHITETVDEYISTLRDMVQVINELEGVYLLIRPHPVCNLSPEEFRFLLPESSRIRFLLKGPFSRILSAADLLISYSSTCIEEALQNQIPVVLYDKWKRYNHFHLNEMTNGQWDPGELVWYVTSQLALKKILQSFDSDKINSIDSKNLVKYQYPSQYKREFFSFVQRTLQNQRSQ